ncbi:MAG: PAS domain-containing hybrid sensor histidine kinase/response regulator [Nitrospirae bacterium]|nr:MAG: PAS domain-containing hybrid sensor histidine kinase/response regulator [Nitrospirota bacterium]
MHERMKTSDPTKHALLQEIDRLRRRLANLEPILPRSLPQEHASIEPEQWEAAFNALPEQVMILDCQGHILWANRAVYDRFPHLRSSLIGRHYRIPYYGTEDTTVPSPWDSVLSGALSATVEARLPALDGWFLVSCYPLFDQERRQWGAVSIVKDITDHKRIEDALRNVIQGTPGTGGVAFFRTLVRDVAQALNMDYALLVEFPGRNTHQGMTVAVWGGNQFLDNFPWTFPQSFIARVRSSKACFFNCAASSEFSNDPVVGPWNIGSYIGSALFGSSGHMIGFLIVLGRTPVSNVQTAGAIVRMFAVRAASELERTRAEEALRDSEQRYRAIVENAYDLMIETTPNGGLLYLSPNCLAVLGYDAVDMTGYNFFDFVHPDEREAVARLFAEKVANLCPGEIMCRLQHKNGTWRWFESHFRPFRTTAGEVVAIIDTRDITERRHLEEERLRASKLESVGLLAGGIAHDFNNILTSAFANIGLARMLIAKHKSDSHTTIAERLAAAEKACLRARDLTKQLLTFAKGGAPVKNTASIGHFITETIEFALRGSDVRCVIDIPENLWSVEVDEGQMSQVIQNLIMNADHAMPHGGIISVRAQNTHVAPDTPLPLKEGRYVMISIEDQGTGIAPEHLPQIFDPYFTTKEGGTGLGLATTYSIMKRHDGHITVTSELGVGTTFHLYLPASSSNAIARVPAEHDHLITGTGRVIIMDDEPDIRDILSKMLCHLGFEVDQTSDGNELIARYQAARAHGQPYRFAIMDLTIPGGMGGKETVRQLKALDPHVLAFVSSGYSNDPVMAHPEEFGFIGVIVKPYNLSDLSRVLSRALHASSRSTQL